MDFYNKAGLVLDRLDARKGSLKSIVFDLAARRSAWPTRSKGKGRDDVTNDGRRVSDAKRLLKVSVEVLKFRQALRDIIDGSGLLSREARAFKAPSGLQALHPTPVSLATVLLHDFIFAKRGIALSKDHRFRVLFERQRKALDAAKARVKSARGVRDDAGLASTSDHDGARDRKPRWLRVNTRKWPVEEALASFKALGYTVVDSVDEIWPSSQKLHVDAHLPYLFALHPDTALATLESYRDGRLIVQEKASCFPPALLLADAASAEVNVIDATAAPGNKTTLLSALTRGKVWAFERDRKRFLTLSKMLSIAGCDGVGCFNEDFLAVEPSDPRFSKVSRILLDPSCSGSGIVSRLDHLQPLAAPDADRLASLSSFQTQLLHHALRFPSVTRVAYSTCSLHVEEDEAVVARVLGRRGVRDAGWRVAEVQGGLRGWQRRGRPVEGLSDDEVGQMLRADPALDPTIGFFAVVLERSLDAQDPVAAHPPHGLLSPPPSDTDVVPATLHRRRDDDVRRRSKRWQAGGRWRGIRPGRLVVG